MGFDINNFLNAESKKEVKSDWKPVKLSVHKLRPAAGCAAVRNIADTSRVCWCAARHTRSMQSKGERIC